MTADHVSRLPLRRAICAALFLMLTSLPLSSQTMQRFGDMRISLLGGAGYTLGTGEFQTVCACSFLSGPGGFGAYAGMSVSYAYNEVLSGAVRVSYIGIPAVYQNESEFIRYNQDGSQTVTRFRREATFTLGAGAIALLAEWRGLVDNLTLSVGPEAMITVSDKYHEQEDIIAGPGAYASTGTRTLLLADGDVSDTFAFNRFTIGMLLLASYELPLDGRLSITPEIGWHLQFTTMLQDFSSLRLMPLRAGVGVTLRL